MSFLEQKPESEKEMSELQRVLQEKEILLDDYEKQFESLRTELQQFAHEVRRKEEAVDELVEQKRSLEGLLQVRDVELDDLRRKQLEEEQEQVVSKNFEELMKVKDAEIQQLNESLSEKSVLSEELLENVAALKEENVKSQEKIAKLEGEKQNYISELENSISQQNITSDLEERLKDTEELLNRSYLSVEESQNKLNEFQELYHETRTALEQSEKRNLELQETLEHYLNDKNALEMISRQTEEQILKLENEIRGLKESLSQRGKDAADGMELMKRKDDQIELLKSEIETRDVEISSMRSNAGLAEELKRELEAAKFTITDLEQRLETSSKKRGGERN